MTKTLKQQTSAWEKKGRALLDTLLDSLAPFVREFADDEALDDSWPDDPEEIWTWVSADLVRLGNLGDYATLFSAFASDDCCDWSEKVAQLIVEKWPSPNDVPNVARTPAERREELRNA